MEIKMIIEGIVAAALLSLMPVAFLVILGSRDNKQARSVIKTVRYNTVHRAPKQHSLRAKIDQ